MSLLAFHMHPKSICVTPLEAAFIGAFKPLCKDTLFFQFLLSLVLLSDYPSHFFKKSFSISTMQMTTIPEKCAFAKIWHYTQTSCKYLG